MKRIYILILSVLVFASVSRADEISVNGTDWGGLSLPEMPYGVEIDYWWGYLDTDTGEVTPEYTQSFLEAFPDSVNGAVSYVNLIKGKAYDFAVIDERNPYYPYFGSTGTAYRTYDISNTPEPLEGWELVEGIYLTDYDSPPILKGNTLTSSNGDTALSVDDTDGTIKVASAALSDASGTNMISLADDGAVSLGGNNMLVINNESIRLEGSQLIAKKKEDGAIHIGENSLITIEQDGVQKLYARDANGEAIDIDITNGSDLLINGVSVAERLNSNKIYTDIIANKLADGIEDSNAMSAALSALPNTAPDAESYCGGGLGSYGESQAFSLGCASNINDNLTVNFGASKLASGGASIGNREFDDYSLKAGFIYKIGYKPSKGSKPNTARLETELYRQQASLRAIAEKENYKDTKIAEYESRLAKLEEQRAIETAEYKHKFTKLEEQLEELKVAMLAGNKEFASLSN